MGQGPRSPHVDGRYAYAKTCRVCNLADGLAPHTGVIIAEVGFLLILFAGIWFVAAEVPGIEG